MLDVRGHTRHPRLMLSVSQGSIYWKIPPPQEKISANVMWGEKYEKGKRVENARKKEERGKKKEKGEKRKRKIRSKCVVYWEEGL